MTSCTHFTFHTMLTIKRFITDIGRHRQTIENRFRFTSTIGTIQGVFNKIENSAKLIANVFIRLLMAGVARHPIERQTIQQQLSHGIEFLAVMMRCKMTQRRMARCALVFKFQLVRRVDGDLLAHFGLPKRIFRRVGHQRTAPIIRNIHIPAIRHGDCGVRLTNDTRIVIRVGSVTPCTLTTACKQAIHRVRKTSISRTKGRRMIGVPLFMQTIRPLSPAHKDHSPEGSHQNCPD